MFDLPLTTHRNLIEPLSGYPHLKSVLVKRFLNFTAQIEKSSKSIPKQLLTWIREDVRSTTGNNLRKIMLLTGNSFVHQVNISDAIRIKYHPLPEDDKWRVSVIKELTDVQFGRMEAGDMNIDEIEEMRNFVATS